VIVKIKLVHSTFYVHNVIWRPFINNCRPSDCTLLGYTIIINKTKTKVCVSIDISMISVFHKLAFSVNIFRYFM